MTIAKLRKELEKYNDNDVVVDVAWLDYGYRFHNRTNIVGDTAREIRIISAEEWKELNKEN